jgi:mitochondrial fission protein ELM1
LIEAWTLTTGEDGMRTQARGLAAAIADRVVERTTPPLSAWSPARLGWIPPRPFEGFAAPWPDVLVSCGRRSIPHALEAKRRSGGGVVLVHVQDPRGAAARFDAVVAMAHDRIAAGPRVLKVATALHDLTPAILADAASPWRLRFVALGPAFAGVVVGGDLKGRPFGDDDAHRLIAGLARIRAGSPLGLAITPSRRTPASVRALLERTYRDDLSVFLWDLDGDNPYRAILGLADRLIVTGDSVSMISEAISTPTSVDVLDLGFPRHAGFLQSLIDSGRVRRFEGDPDYPRAAEPVNATEDAARMVRRLLAERAAQT